MRACTCSEQQVRKYQQRISGPMLDRFDIQLDVQRVDYDKLTDEHRGEPSEAIQLRVEAARERQRERYKDLPGVLTNSDIGAGEVDQVCKMDDSAKNLLGAVMRKLQLSARSYHRVLKLAGRLPILPKETLSRPNMLQKLCSNALELCSVSSTKFRVITSTEPKIP